MRLLTNIIKYSTNTRDALGGRLLLHLNKGTLMARYEIVKKVVLHNLHNGISCNGKAKKIATFVFGPFPKKDDTPRVEGVYVIQSILALIPDSNEADHRSDGDFFFSWGVEETSLLLKKTGWGAIQREAFKNIVIGMAPYHNWEVVQS